MKKFIINSILFFFSIVSFFLVGILLPNNSKVRSIDYSILKKHQLLENEKNAKIILTGGSNVLFGFNSKMLTDSLQKKTINHSIHAGYGLKYILDDAEHFAKEDDVIVLSPEYSHFLGTGFWGKEPLLFSLTAKPENLKLISLKQYVNVLGFIPKFSIERIKSFAYNVIFSNKNVIDKQNRKTYGEFAINEFGDNDTHWKKSKQNFKFYNFQDPLNHEAFNYLANFQKKAQEKGVKLLLVYPSLCNSVYNQNKEIIEKIDSELKKRKINVVGKPSDFTYNDNLFFDSPYHLNGEGVKIRTKQVLSILKN